MVQTPVSVVYSYLQTFKHDSTFQLEFKAKVTQPIYVGLQKTLDWGGWASFRYAIGLDYPFALPQDNSRDRMVYLNSQYS